MSELVWCAPFALLLLSIALGPLLAKHAWEKHYPVVSIALALVICAYYLFLVQDVHPIWHSLQEYFSFICLIGSLFIISGGIHIRVKGESTPLANVLFLLFGAILSNFLGTTGASMVLIRPWMRMNMYRLTAYHIIFFIFVVSNIGGMLTPIGDPPLFLGYLRGVPFLWVLEHLWGVWLVCLTFVLSIFFVVDYQNFMRAPKKIRDKETGHAEEWRLDGGHNFLLLLMVISSVFVQNPIFLREALMIAASLISYFSTRKSIHEMNHFNFGPIREVAILFIGIFTTMLPALHWLEKHASSIGIQSASQFYWYTGSLSAVLDNAPTYLNFLTAAVGVFVSTEHGSVSRESVLALLTNHPIIVMAISAGAVLFGAMTYIGNGPNFLVKSIAEEKKVRMPSFLGYVFRYSAPALLPTFFVVWLLFFKSR